MRKRIVQCLDVEFLRDMALAAAEGLSMRRVFFAVARIEIGILSDASEEPVGLTEDGTPIFSFPIEKGWAILFEVKVIAKGAAEVIRLRSLCACR